MSNITTDFITATKKIHADVRAVLTALHLIGNDVKAIREQGVSKTDKPSADDQAANSEQQPSMPSGGSHTLNTGQANRKNQNGHDNTQSGLRRFGQKWWKTVKKPRIQIELLALLGLSFYTCETRRTNNLTEQSLNANWKQFRIQQRPNISIMAFKIADIGGRTKNDNEEFDIGKPLVVNITFRNIGKTFAVDLITHRHLLFGKDVDRIKIEPADDVIQGDTVDAGADRTITALSLRNTYMYETPDIDSSDIVTWDGSQPVIVFGRISYKDTEGVFYCTPYIVKRIPNNWVLVSAFARGKTTFSVKDLCPKGER